VRVFSVVCFGNKERERERGKEVEVAREKEAGKNGERRV
jgi:hypothetical protein